MLFNTSHVHPKSINSWLWLDNWVSKEYAVINWFSFHGLQDKKYYPTAEEVYGPEVEVRIILSPAI